VIEHSLPVDPRAVVVARGIVREELSAELPSQKVTDAELLVTELVANAVQHDQLDQQDSIRLAVETASGSVRVSVVDAGRGFPPDMSAHDRDVGGCGLVVVQKVSDRWGIDGDPHTVWFELRR
jgi:anti-sigma regulatory factor (Ser/Thr protein kinase)